MEQHSDLLQSLYSAAKKDPWYNECLRICQERESAFLGIRSQLTEQAQETLDLYIAACEDLQFSLVILAYSINRSV
jgi:hypothetical protein